MLQLQRLHLTLCVPAALPLPAAEWGRHLIGSRGGPGADGWQLRNFEPEDRRHLTILQLAGVGRVCAAGTMERGTSSWL